MKSRQKIRKKRGKTAILAEKESKNVGKVAKTAKNIAVLRGLKVALVCDWLTNVGGAEQVLRAIHEVFPEAPIYTSQYDPKNIDWFADADVRTGWMQKIPVKMRRVVPWVRQRYFEKLDLSGYDLVVSVTGAEAKGVKTGPRTLHLSYCHVPTQYYWQFYRFYVENPGFGALNPVARAGFKLFVKSLRARDFAEAQRPDRFITISRYATGLIKKYYRRESVTISPPVALENFALAGRPKELAKKRSGLVMTARQVAWKRHDLAIRACLATGQRLTIIGEGPENRALRGLAGGSELIEFVPRQEAGEIAKYLWRARGFLFPSMEPFGIAPVEALAAGCPVVAFGEGGSRDYIEDGKNGVFFGEQTVEAMARGIERFLKLDFDEKKVAKSAEKFAEEKFKERILEYAAEEWGEFVKKNGVIVAFLS